MALDVRNIYSIIAGSTANNVNGGGFNPFNASFPTDLATTNGTSAAPTVSAAYAFTAADVTAGAWVYIAAGTDWIQGFYQIASRSGGVATLNATIGAAVIWNSTQGRWTPSTAQGVATQDTPGGNATYGVDYSQSTAAVQNSTTATNTVGVITVGSLTYDTNLLGNVVQVVAGASATQGWYEVASVVAGVSMTLDRDPGGTTNISINIGGAFSLNSATANRTDDSVFELGAGTNGTGSVIFFVKGSLTLATAVSAAAAGGTHAPVNVVGYSSVRGDNPLESTRPTIACAALGIAFTGAYWRITFLILTGTTSPVLSLSSTGGRVFSCKVTNSSTSASRASIQMGGIGACVVACETVSYRGFGVYLQSQSMVSASYSHDSDIGFIGGSNTRIQIINCISASNKTSAIGSNNAYTNGFVIYGNILYGSEAKLGSGIILITGSLYGIVINNIIYGFTTGIVCPDVDSMHFSDYNDFYNNTVDVAATAGGSVDYTRWQKGPHDQALDPVFASAGQRTGSTATITSGNHIVQAGATFVTWGVTAGRDFVYYSAGSGAGTKGIYGIASVDSETQITVDLTLTADATGDHVWSIPDRNNFGIGTNLKALGYPGVFPAALTTGYLDIGAVQRQESGGSGGGAVLQSSILHGVGVS